MPRGQRNIKHTSHTISALTWDRLFSNFPTVETSSKVQYVSFFLNSRWKHTCVEFLSSHVPSEIGRKTTRVFRWHMRSNILIDSCCPPVVRSSSKQLHYRLHLCNVRLQERYLTNRFHYGVRRIRFMATKRCTCDDSIRLELAQTSLNI